MSANVLAVLACFAALVLLVGGVVAHARRRGRAPWGSVAIAILLFALDPVLLGLGIVLALGCLVGILVAAAGFALAVHRGRPEARLAAGYRVLLFAGTTVTGVATVYFNFQVADERAAEVTSAVESYRRDHGELPSALGELTPRYLDEVPSPRLVPRSRFLYDARNGTLSFVVGPMMGKVYDFDSRTWGPLDAGG